MFIIIRFLEILSILIYMYVIFSLFPSMRNSRFGVNLARIVEPFLSVIRSVVPPVGAIDFSPIIMWLLIELAIRGAYGLGALN